MSQLIRCAIYTRKSTDEGLDKEFNTLEAQREACESYILSQKIEGWKVVKEHYDDGGFSGGNMKRPAFQRLINDIKAGLVDMVVVYKIDRLTRSLLDFAKIVEIFDAHRCSFTSVTQHFNTADSMGRLLLNILLSFAQFEREVSSDRIRDKLAASRKKGMWTGGNVPFGYDVVDKKLIVNQKEAKIVKFMFETYVASKSEKTVLEACNINGYKQKPRLRKNGLHIEARPFIHNTLSNILRNPIYIGKIPYKGETYEGRHEAIISKEIFDKAQLIKKENLNGRLSPSKSVKNSLLKGFIECECCQTKMVPTRCRKKDKYYEYYTSLKAINEGYHKCSVGNIPAGELDEFVINHLKSIMQAPEVIQELTHQVKMYKPDITLTDIYNSLQSIDKVFAFFMPATLRQIIQQTIEKIIVGKSHIKIQFKPFGLRLMDNNLKTAANGFNKRLMEFTYPTAMFRKHGRKIIVCPEEIIEQGKIDPVLVKAVCQAFSWQKQVQEFNTPLKELAVQERVNRSYMGSVMRLTYLAPDIIEAILKGTQPRHLNLETFIRHPIPYLWSEQRKLYKMNC